MRGAPGAPHSGYHLSRERAQNGSIPEERGHNYSAAELVIIRSGAAKGWVYLERRVEYSGDFIQGILFGVETSKIVVRGRLLVVLVVMVVAVVLVVACP